MRLKDKFHLKTKTIKEHQHDITYHAECPEENCNENDVEVTGHRLSERNIDHDGRDKSSHILKYSVEREHRPLSLQEFSTLGGTYRKNKFCRIVALSLLLKEKRSTLNKQEKSISLKLFN